MRPCATEMSHPDLNPPSLLQISRLRAMGLRMPENFADRAREGKRRKKGSARLGTESINVPGRSRPACGPGLLRCVPRALVAADARCAGARREHGVAAIQDCPETDCWLAIVPEHRCPRSATSSASIAITSVINGRRFDASSCASGSFSRLDLCRF